VVDGVRLPSVDLRKLGGRRGLFATQNVDRAVKLSKFQFKRADLFQLWLNEIE
jgi:hypothetical protein